MMVKQAFCESADGGVRRNITCRVDKSISKIQVCSNDNKALDSIWKRANIINLPLGGRVILRNSAILGTLY